LDIMRDRCSSVDIAGQQVVFHAKLVTAACRQRVPL
jgi:hypothetical protein